VREKAKAGTEKNTVLCFSLQFLPPLHSSLAGVVSPFCFREKERE